MKVEFYETPTRGSQEVRVGHVYELQHGHRKRRWRYKVVVGSVPPDRNGRPAWSSMVVLHITEEGVIVGADQLPYNYLKEHHNLVGHVNGLQGFRFATATEPSAASMGLA